MFKMNNGDRLQYIEDKIAELTYKKEELTYKLSEINEQLEELEEEQLGYWQEERADQNMEYERSV